MAWKHTVALLCNLFWWGKKKEDEEEKDKKAQLKVPSKMGSKYAAVPTNFQDPATKEKDGSVFSDFVKDTIIKDEDEKKSEKNIAEPKSELVTTQSNLSNEKKTSSEITSSTGSVQTSPQKELKKLSKKMVMLGDGGCGKTSLIKKFVYSTFDDKYLHTIGVHITKKEIPYPEEGVAIVLNIWDIQGQKNLVNYESNVTGALGAFIVCDITRNQTLEHMPDWIDMMKRKAPNGKMILIANKWDLKERAEFGEFQMKYLANKHNCLWFPTSAKTGENVENAFKAMADLILEMHKKGN